MVGRNKSCQLDYKGYCFNQNFGQKSIFLGILSGSMQCHLLTAEGIAKEVLREDLCLVMAQGKWASRVGSSFAELPHFSTVEIRLKSQVTDLRKKISKT